MLKLTNENIAEFARSIGPNKFLRRGQEIVCFPGSKDPKHAERADEIGWTRSDIEDAGQLFAAGNRIEVSMGASSLEIKSGNPNRPITIQVLQAISQGADISIKLCDY